jgi:hypothetical protein
MDWKMSNEDVSIGDIFVHGSTQEVGHNAGFYKVVEKRGKSIVIIRRVDYEVTGREGPNEIEIKALPDKITGEEQRVRAYIKDNGMTVLAEINSRYWKNYYDRGDTAWISGWFAGWKKESVSRSHRKEDLP